MKQKHIAIIVLVVALLGASVYAMSNSKKSIEKPPVQGNTTKPTNTVDTSDWLTYRNEKYGYEVKYPKQAEVSVYGVDRDRVGIPIAKYLQIPADLHEERGQKEGKGSGPGISIRIDNPTTKYTSPCVWYYAERENLNVESYDPAICDPSKPYVSDSDYARGYFTTFAGEPAYVRILNTLGTEGGVYADQVYDIAFFRNGHTWEVAYSGIPDHPTDKWKTHPYYPYLEKALPVTEAIINSFRFVDATSTVGVR